MKGLFHTLILPLLLAVTPALSAAETPPDAAAATETSASPAPLSRQEAALAALKETPLKGEKLELNENGTAVFSLFTPANGKRRGGVVLLHDIGGHVDSPGVIHPLRNQLPEYGWATLSIMLPPLDGDQPTTAWLDSCRSRIAAAISELKQRGIESVVLAGHGQGALAAADYLTSGGSQNVKGLIVIGMDGSLNKQEPRLDGSEVLARVQVPILDIFGGHDFTGVLNSAQRRASAAQRREGDEKTAHSVYSDIARNYTEQKGDKVGYRQLRIAPASHDFTRQEALLVRRVRGWLGRYIAGK
jgi:pimeloyl-ACP methyl ester carboxylesterase